MFNCLSLDSLLFAIYHVGCNSPNSYLKRQLLTKRHVSQCPLLPVIESLKQLAGEQRHSRHSMAHQSSHIISLNQWLKIRSPSTPLCFSFKAAPLNVLVFLGLDNKWRCLYLSLLPCFTRSHHGGPSSSTLPRGRLSWPQPSPRRRFGQRSRLSGRYLPPLHFRKSARALPVMRPLPSGFRWTCRERYSACRPTCLGDPKLTCLSLRFLRPLSWLGPLGRSER